MGHHGATSEDQRGRRRGCGHPREAVDDKQHGRCAREHEMNHPSVAPTCAWHAGSGTALCGEEDTAKPTRRSETLHPCGWRRSTSWTATVLGQITDEPP